MASVASSSISSFSPILDSTPAPAIVSAPNDITAASDASAAPALTKSDLLTIGSYLFDILQLTFDAYPKLDELGLILGMPASGLGRKKGGAATPATIESEPCLSSYHTTHSPPPQLLQLQQQNESPPFIVIESTKIGISFWSVPFIVKYTIGRYRKVRERMQAAAADTTTMDQATATELLNCTRILLLINADNYTAWNSRKLLLTLSPPSSSAPFLTPTTELRLLNLIYSKHPKSGESWNHRRWLLSHIDGFKSLNENSSSTIQPQQKHAIASIEVSPLPGATLSTFSTHTSASSAPSSLYHTSLFQNELSICSRTAELYPKNYYAWMHRQYLVECLSDRKDIMCELETSNEWTESHINDYCGFFHRQSIWNQWLRAGSVGSGGQQKQSTVKNVHEHLIRNVKQWSKRYEFDLDTSFSSLSHDTTASSSVASTSAASSSPAPSSAIPHSTSSHSQIDTSLHASLATCSFCQQFSSTEFSHLNDLQLKYPGHETLWMYRRWVWLMSIYAISKHTTITTGIKPSWLAPLLQRELDYADFQIRDHELTDYEVNKRYALVYKVWCAHTTLSLIYGEKLMEQTKEQAQTSIPLSGHLSSAHTKWYTGLVRDVTQLEPRMMNYQHWNDRRDMLLA